MKITADKPEASLGGLQANAFQLTNSAKIIDIVINKMYTNKPGAVIRELAANAWDAHCEADNREIPFEIHLPTWLEKTFMIRDYGIGIPHDMFESIYTNIGGSTKDDNDDFIGGFGLGSKTPFTMVDSFTVENWWKGSKTTWLCFKSAGNPQVTKLAEEASDEPSGLKVSFVFEDDEVAEFTKQLTKQLKYFPVKPIVTGGENVQEWEELPDGWETKDYFYSKQRDVHSWNRTHFVVMGNVAYDLKENEIDAKHNNLFRESLTLKVPIGSVDIPPSRENLEYTKKTKDYLNKILEGIRKHYDDEFTAEIKKATSYLELRKKVYNANANLISLRTFTYDNEEYTWNQLSRSFLNSSEYGLNIKKITSRYSNVFRSSNVSMLDICVGIDLYINDIGIGATAHINAEYSSIPDNAYIVDPAKGTKKTRQSLLDADSLAAEKFFGVKPKLLSKLIGLPKVGAKGTRAKPDQIFKVMRQGHSVKASVESVTDIPTEGYMLPMSGWDVEEGTFRGKVKELGAIADELDKPIYLVRKHTRKLVTGLKDASHLSAALDELLIPRVQKYLDHKQLQCLLSRSQMENLRKHEWKGVNNLIYLLLKFHSRLTQDNVGYHSYCKAKELISVSDLKGSAFVSKRTQGFIDIYNTRWERLVSALGTGWNSPSNFEALHNFIKQENT